MLTVSALAVVVSFVVSGLLYWRHDVTWTAYGITWNIATLVVLTVLVPATLAVVANYPYWHPKRTLTG
jgi:hypothetical protein